MPNSAVAAAAAGLPPIATTDGCPAAMPIRQKRYPCRSGYALNVRRMSPSLTFAVAREIIDVWLSRTAPALKSLAQRSVTENIPSKCSRAVLLCVVLSITVGAVTNFRVLPEHQKCNYCALYQRTANVQFSQTS